MDHWGTKVWGTALAGVAQVGLLLMAGCVPFDNVTSEPPPGQLVQSSKTRITSPSVVETDLDTLVAGNNAFAFDMYAQVRDTDGNLFYSPYSISIALAMTYAGARGDTDQQMADALQFALGQDGLPPAFNALDLELAGRSDEATDQGGDPFQLNIVNRIWGQVDLTFRDEFLDVLAEHYGASLSLMDFANNPEPARIEINDWVAAQTADRIKDLIPQGAINTLTRLVLTNAIYFKAAWLEPFEEANTTDQPFHLLSGDSVTAETMRQDTEYGYAAGDGYQVIELPYDGSALSMVILLPDSGRFDEFEGTLDATGWDAMLDEVVYGDVDLSLPKFTFESSLSLAEVLAELGMPIAFDPDDADFSGMTDEAQLFISDVIHKAFVAVDEEGTEAAAATAVTLGATSAPSEPVVVNVDRPFVFLIRDIPTGSILFIGRVVDPSGS